MNEEVATRFEGRLAGLRDAVTYAACFPYQNLLTEAPIPLFHGFYAADTLR
jgi:hypothetical protein